MSAASRTRACVLSPSSEFSRSVISPAKIDPMVPSSLTASRRNRPHCAHVGSSVDPIVVPPRSDRPLLECSVARPTPSSASSRVFVPIRDSAGRATTFEWHVSARESACRRSRWRTRKDMTVSEVDRSKLPIRRKTFDGVVDRTLDGSQPDWNLIGHPTPAGRRAERPAGPHRRRRLREPEHVRRARSRRRTTPASPRAACATTGSTSPRCARRRARRC